MWSLMYINNNSVYFYNSQSKIYIIVIYIGNYVSLDGQYHYIHQSRLLYNYLIITTL